MVGFRCQRQRLAIARGEVTADAHGQLLAVAGDHVATLLDLFAGYGVWGATFGTGLLIAFLSSVMNNMPTVLVGALSIDASHAEGIVREAMIHANVIGSALGPTFTPIGSLATLLWLHVLARKTIRITWGYYFKVGVVLTDRKSVMKGKSVSERVDLVGRLNIKKNKT